MSEAKMVRLTTKLGYTSGAPGWQLAESGIEKNKPESETRARIGVPIPDSDFGHFEKEVLPVSL